MTTNVIDLSAKVVASDSRWSWLDGNNLHFVDDTAFDKIAVCEDVVMICAGDAGLIGDWRDWVQKPKFYDLPIPNTEIDRNGTMSPIYVALITRPEGELIYCKGIYWLVDGTFMFTGTGGDHARVCFGSNKDIEQCIVTASEKDHHTGGQVRKVDVVTGKGNLANPAKGVQDIHDSYVQRGQIMDLVSNTKKSVAPATAAANDQTAQAKQMHFSAPTGQTPAPWTSEDHLRLGKALKSLAYRAENRAKK